MNKFITDMLETHYKDVITVVVDDNARCVSQKRSLTYQVIATKERNHGPPRLSHCFGDKPHRRRTTKNQHKKHRKPLESNHPVDCCKKFHNSNDPSYIDLLQTTECTNPSDFFSKQIRIELDRRNHHKITNGEHRSMLLSSAPENDLSRLIYFAVAAAREPRNLSQLTRKRCLGHGGTESFSIAALKAPALPLLQRSLNTVNTRELSSMPPRKPVRRNSLTENF